jgi:hypothetical protein
MLQVYQVMLVHQVIHLVVQTFYDVISNGVCVELMVFDLEAAYFYILLEVPCDHEKQLQIQVFSNDL